MVSTLQPTSTTAWSKVVFQSAQEFGPVPLAVLTGVIPPGLRGSLYRNGPASLQRNGQRVGHWFDGDGGILGLHFTDAGAIGLYRYVQTAGYQAERKAGRFLLSGYGMLPPGRIWERWGKPVKNAANTSVLALPDKVLALWEGAEPHALTLDRLETLGLDDLGNLKGRPYSAHPKVDPQTRDIFNFGVTVGLNGTLNVYRSDATGKIRQQHTIALRGIPIIHDFVLAGRYLVFCVPPVRINVLPVLLQLKSFSDAMNWQPHLGTEILVVDRDSLELVCRLEADPWYQWHFGNGYELPDGTIGLELVRYQDFQTNQQLKELATGAMHTPAVGTLWQLRLDPQAGKVLELHEVLNRSCEFPIVQPSQVGQSSRHTYLNVHRQGTDTLREVFDAIACFDHAAGTLTETDMGSHRYPSEPIYAPDADRPEQGWILTVVYDGDQHQSEVWIYQADRLDDEPVCRLAIPEVVPLSFHGTWKSA